MKISIAIPFVLGVFLLSTVESVAQQKQDREKKENTRTEEEEGPLMFRFEPDYVASEEARLAEIQRKKERLDTMDISEGRRKKLIRDLYRNKETKRLSKILVTDTEFEDIEE